MRVRVKGLKQYKDRHGKLRLYHRASSTPIDPKLSGAEIAAEVARLDALNKPIKPRAGSLSKLFASYRQSPKFTDLALRTKDDYHRVMAELEPLKDMPLIEFTPGFAAQLRDRMVKTKRAGFTNHMLAMLSSAFQHGVEYEIVSKSPMLGLRKAKIDKSRRRPIRPWTPLERQNVLSIAQHPLLVPLALAKYLGMRRGDIVVFPRASYSNGTLNWKSSKTGRIMSLPAVGELRSILDDAPTGDSTLLCLNSYGKPWTADGLSTSLHKFFKQCVKRGIAETGITLHGLRHSVATTLKEGGWNNEQIKDYLGHETGKMTGHYSSTANVNGALIDMASMLQSGSKREQKLSNRRK